MSKVLAIVVGIVFAFSCTMSFAESGKVASGMGHKLSRGVVNAGTGWIELFKEMYQTGKENPVKGVTVGAVEGSAKTALRTTAGGIEAGTFLFPVPKNYEEPLLQPEFVF